MIPKFRFYSKRMNKIGIVISLKPLRKRVYVEWDDTLSGTEDIDDNGVLMQSTGLFDKNGKEIFEGDVVSFSIDNGWDYVVSKNGLIIYSDGCYQILENGIKYRINQCLEEDIEVIGNMYELERVEK